MRATEPSESRDNLQSKSDNDNGRVIYFVLHVLLPLLLGTLIYFFRDRNIVAFYWLYSTFDFELLQGIPRTVIQVERIVPTWIRFNLADGLWVYSLTALMIFMWNRKIDMESLLWVFSGLFIAVVSEICQGLKLLPGIYDSKDIIFYFAGFLWACRNLLPNFSVRKLWRGLS